MADSKKLTRAEVYKKIDDFRGISRAGAAGKPSLEQWVAAKRVDAKSPPRRAGNGKVMHHGWIRIKLG